MSGKNSAGNILFSAAAKWWLPTYVEEYWKTPWKCWSHDLISGIKCSAVLATVAVGQNFQLELVTRPRYLFLQMHKYTNTDVQIQIYKYKLVLSSYLWLQSELI